MTGGVHSRAFPSSQYCKIPVFPLDPPFLRKSGTAGRFPVFRIKICGITTAEDGLRAARAGADAVGLNFFPESPRFVNREAAREIAAALPGEVTRVGVFVNADLSEMVETAETVGLDVIQLHGDEPPVVVGQLAPRSVNRAFRCRDSGLTPVRDYLDECRRRGSLPQSVLLDAFAPDKYGGTGQCLDWTAVRGAGEQLGGLPIVLAGGLTPENVGAAIAAARPAAVDTAGGVESAPGVKDAAKLVAFVAAARTAFQFNGGQS
jgi:phosphoribosylanthranilate isomerase